MRTAIAFAAAGVLAIQSLEAERPSSSAASSALTIVPVPSESLGGTIPVAVLLPSTYTQSERRYPVLYLLHGGGQDHMVFTTRPWFAEQALHEIIIVTPSVGESWYVNSVADPKAKYEDFVVKDLVVYVDKHYRTVALRQGRSVAGVSMGGWGAMLLGLKHHQLFGTVGAMSAPFLISRQSPNMDMTSREQQGFGAPGTRERLERDPATLVDAIPLESVPRLYLACGNQDLFVTDSRRFVERLTKRKIPYEYPRNIATGAFVGSVGRSDCQLHSDRFSLVAHRQEVVCGIIGFWAAHGSLFSRRSRAGQCGGEQARAGTYGRRRDFGARLQRGVTQRQHHPRWARRSLARKGWRQSGHSSATDALQGSDAGEDRISCATSRSLYEVIRLRSRSELEARSERAVRT